MGSSDIGGVSKQRDAAKTHLCRLEVPDRLKKRLIDLAHDFGPCVAKKRSGVASHVGDVMPSDRLRRNAVRLMPARGVGLHFRQCGFRFHPTIPDEVVASSTGRDLIARTWHRIAHDVPVRDEPPGETMKKRSMRRWRERPLIDHAPPCDIT